jgi:hypothetical protein
LSFAREFTWRIVAGAFLVQGYEKPTRYGRGQSVNLARQLARGGGLPKSCLPKDTHKAARKTACQRNGDAFSFLALIGIVHLRAESGARIVVQDYTQQ